MQQTLHILSRLRPRVLPIVATASTAYLLHHAIHTRRQGTVELLETHPSTHPSKANTQSHNSTVSTSAQSSQARRHLPGESATMGSLEVDPAMTDLPPFQMTIAVQMHCESCVQELKTALGAVAGRWISAFTKLYHGVSWRFTHYAPPSCTM